ncbi:MAG: cell wall hydrolase [Veillonellaceae bacterium]|nr:cell wall hydrolase [Veillonellaceae bacterium]
MRILSVRRKVLQKIVVFSIVVVAINLLTLQYFVSEDIDSTDLSSLAGKVIALDPGHGGIDSGAKGNGLSEKDITLAIALKLADILKANGAQVIMTREGDNDYYTRGKGGKRNDLLKRAEIINTSGAQLFVSVHCNAIRDERQKGAQIFYGNQDNKGLAEIAQLALKGFPPGNRRQAKQDNDIVLLKATTIPGILVETGYITNKTEANLLADSSYQQKLANQIAKALAYHFSQNAAR